MASSGPYYDPGPQGEVYLYTPDTRRRGCGPIYIPRAPFAGVGPFIYPGLPTGYGLISIPRAPFAGGCS